LTRREGKGSNLGFKKGVKVGRLVVDGKKRYTWEAARKEATRTRRKTATIRDNRAKQRGRGAISRELDDWREKKGKPTRWERKPKGTEKSGQGK